VNFLDYAPEVKAALDQNQPVVALESTIITHGMPWPDNLSMAQSVEKIISDNGAVPATIAVLNGRIKIGLSLLELEQLAQSKNVSKLSRADLAACLVQKSTGATTVAATMIAASHAGISVFATGGIGGVHQGAENSFDISADLQELAQTSVTVVAAGAKAILDIPKTLEVLETLGVPVISYGQWDFPAFWSAKSNFKAPLRMDDAKEIAAAHTYRRALGMAGGQLVANPIPLAHEIAQDTLKPIIKQAISEAEQQNILAKDVTPFLLGRIFELTNGRSLKANKELVFNNATLAAKIAQFM
jgi:pseudouridine-5'-phosphate glycosidase